MLNSQSQMLVHLILTTLVILANTQLGTYGCYVTLNNIEKDCPAGRLFEMSMLIGTADGANSDDIILHLEFNDANQNPLITLPLHKSPNCNSYQKGNIDVVRLCSSIVELTSSVVIKVTKSDEVQVEALTMSLGNRISTKTRFWFDDFQIIRNKNNSWPVYSMLEFKF